MKRAGALWVLLGLLVGCSDTTKPAVVVAAEPGAEAGAPESPSPHRVVEASLEPGVVWPCGGEHVSNCVGDYTDFVRERSGSPVDRLRCMENLADRFARLAAAPNDSQFLSEPPLPASQMADQIQEAIRLDSVVQARGDSELVVSVTRSFEKGGNTWSELFLTAPPVGRVPFVMIRPTEKTGTPLSVVLGLPGHNTDAYEFLGETFPDLGDHGYLVLVPSFRGYHGVDVEHRVTLELLCVGSSFTAIRHYEVMMGLEYLDFLRDRGEVAKVALVGHSGGAVLANTFAWYQGHRLAGVATDLLTNFLNVSYETGDAGKPIPGTATIMCESNEQLHQLSVPIANFGLAPVMVGRWPYGFEGGRDFLYRWLDERLGVSRD